MSKPTEVAARVHGNSHRRINLCILGGNRLGTADRRSVVGVANGELVV